jgi:hypothetical protein
MKIIGRPTWWTIFYSNYQFDYVSYHIWVETLEVWKRSNLDTFLGSQPVDFMFITLITKINPHFDRSLKATTLLEIQSTLYYLPSL